MVYISLYPLQGWSSLTMAFAGKYIFSLKSILQKTHQIKNSRNSELVEDIYVYLSSLYLSLFIFIIIIERYWKV